MVKKRNPSNLFIRVHLRSSVVEISSSSSCGLLQEEGSGIRDDFWHADLALCLVRGILEHGFPSEAFVELGGERRKAMADQLTTASKERLIRRAGVLSQADIAAVEQAVRVQLGVHGSGP